MEVELIGHAGRRTAIGGVVVAVVLELAITAEGETIGQAKVSFIQEVNLRWGDRFCV